MIKLNLKLIGILCITIFCLAPICASDLNQDPTVVNDSQPIKKNTIDMNNVSKLNTDYYDKLSVHVDDVKKGEPIIIDVYTADFISAGVTVFISGYHGMHFLWLDHGHGQLIIDSSDFDSGTYNVRVATQMYDPQKLEPASTTFTVTD